MQQILEQCRAAIGPAPRRFGFLDRAGYLSIARPAWCGSRDGLSQFFASRGELLREGEVVWGHVVQANTLLFKPGPHNCPGEVAFCPDPARVVDIEELEFVAHSLFDLKGTQPAPGPLRTFAEHLTNERTRAFGLEVPASISPLLDCEVSTIFFARRHLPGGVLSCPFFPILLLPRAPHLVMVLPARYWPPPLLRLWST